MTTWKLRPANAMVQHTRLHNTRYDRNDGLDDLPEVNVVSNNDDNNGGQVFDVK